MFEPTLLIGAIFSIVSGGVYYYVGHSLGRRRIMAPEARVAWSLFVVWWYAIAGASLASGVLSLLGAAGVADLPMFVTLSQVSVLALCAGLFGMTYYLFYLFTGNSRLLAPLTIIYLGYYVWLLYYVNQSVPIEVSVGRWSAGLVYQYQPTGPLITVLLVLLVFPQIIGGAAYFSLFFRVKDVTQKYRVAVVSWSIMLWFLSSFLASVAGLSDFDWWQIASRLIGMAATLAILMAYQPVEWIKHRLGVVSIAEEGA